MSTKICTTCHLEYPETLVYFPPNKNCKHGLNPVCRICYRAYMKSWKDKNRLSLSIRRKELYTLKTRDRVTARIQRIKEQQPLRIRAQILRQGMINRSRQQNLPFDNIVLTVDFLMQMIRNTPQCPCCARLIDYGYKAGKPKDSSPSIDRICPKEGYVLKNIALIC